MKNIVEQDKSETIDDMSDKISQIKYRQLGDCYMIICDNKYQNGERKSELNGKFFDKDGIELQESMLWSSLYKSVNTEVYNMINKRIFEDKFKILQEQDITNLMVLLKEKGENLKNKALLDIHDKENKDYMDISSVGKLLRIQYIPNLENCDDIYYEFYSVNSNGLLEQVELRRRKKIYR